MELALYFVVIALISIGSFWVAGSLYGLFRSPRIYFPFSLATKMALAAVLGGLLLMVGGVILSTVVLNEEMKKRPDYQLWPTVIAGVVISIVCSMLIYFSIFSLAWVILD